MNLNTILKKYSKELSLIIKAINKAQTIAILGHINPDGDCIGSQMGLYSALKLINKDVTLINEGEFKGIYKTNFERYFTFSIDKNYDLYIILDTANIERVGNLHKDIDKSKCVVIDHHITNNNFGKINWISDYFISTSEMVFLLTQKMKIDLTNSDGIQYLLNGLLSDNGFFQHVRPHKSLSLLISYEMIEMGADSKKSYDLMFCNNSLDTLKLFSLTLSRITPENNGKVLWSYITEDDKTQNNGANFESGMLFREMMSISKTKVSIFFKIDNSENRVDVSFRSTDDIDVSLVASYFGGGGHKVAAGVSIKGDFETVKKSVLNKINELL